MGVSGGEDGTIALSSSSDSSTAVPTFGVLGSQKIAATLPSKRSLFNDERLSWRSKNPLLGAAIVDVFMVGASEVLVDMMMMMMVSCVLYRIGVKVYVCILCCVIINIGGKHNVTETHTNVKSALNFS
jgi:hypothetical protein